MSGAEEQAWKREIQELRRASRAGDAHALISAAHSDVEYHGVSVRARAAYYLGKRGDVVAGPVLVSLLDDESESVRFRAAQALNRLRWPPASEALWRVYRREHEPLFIRFA